MKPRKDAPVTKQDLSLLEQRLLKSSAQQKDEILRHFDVSVEAIHHDLVGARADELELLKDRIRRLEKHAGLIPA